MYEFYIKLIRLSKPAEVTDNSNKTLTYYGLCQFTVHYKSVMFYTAGPWVAQKDYLDNPSNETF
jgi:hypothetical protein